MARLAARPVYLMGLAAEPALSFKSWDAMRAPLPFGRASLVLDGPFSAPARLARAETAAVCRDWEERMAATQRRAEEAIARVSG